MNWIEMKNQLPPEGVAKEPEITLRLTFSLSEWEQIVLPLADRTLEAMRERQMRIPKRISRSGIGRLAFGLPPGQWGNGDRLDGHRPHEKKTAGSGENPKGDIK